MNRRSYVVPKNKCSPATPQDRCQVSGIDRELTHRVKSQMLSRGETSGVAEIFRSLGDPNRIRIVFALSRSELCVCELSEVVELSQSAVSHQLRVLRALNLVKARKDGKKVFYALDDRHVVRLFEQCLEHVRE